MAATLTSTAETSRRDLPGKQNSLKQLNVTQEKINNGKKKNKEEERKSGGGRRRRKRRKETSHTPDSHYAAKKKRSLVFVKIIKTKRNIQNWADLLHWLGTVCVSLLLECKN